MFVFDVSVPFEELKVTSRSVGDAREKKQLLNLQEAVYL